jgi:hypothetical protein
MTQFQIEDGIQFDRVENRGRKSGSKNSATVMRDEAIEVGVYLTRNGATNAEAAKVIQRRFKLPQTEGYIARLIGERRTS